jgi:hypothetical protein
LKILVSGLDDVFRSNLSASGHPSEMNRNNVATRIAGMKTHANMQKGERLFSRLSSGVLRPKIGKDALP